MLEIGWSVFFGVAGSKRLVDAGRVFGLFVCVVDVSNFGLWHRLAQLIRRSENQIFRAERLF